MTDLKICKRIAEIEGVSFDCIDGKIIKIRQGKVTMNKEYHELNDMMKKLYASGNTYNPLTDDALCFQLMVKYDLDFQSPYRPNGDIDYTVDFFINGASDAGSVSSKDPNRAICLAIIEAHNG